MEPVNVEVYVIVNDDGDYSCGADLDAATEKFEEEYGGTVRRVLLLSVEVPRPVIQELRGKATAEPSAVGGLTVQDQ
jgi:hypothetical protein